MQNVTSSGTQQVADAMDLYGFFHGHDYAGALQDFTTISGKTIMVRKATTYEPQLQYLACMFESV